MCTWASGKSTYNKSEEYLVTRDVRERDVATRKGAKRCGGYTASEAELEPSFFTFVVSTFATSPSTRVLGLVAKVLTTKVTNEGSVTYVQNPRAIPCNTCTWASGKSTYNKSDERRFSNLRSKPKGDTL
jgi:hypothetical protein